jgi:hypothetical protein
VEPDVGIVEPPSPVDPEVGIVDPVSPVEPEVGIVAPSSPTEPEVGTTTCVSSPVEPEVGRVVTPSPNEPEGGRVVAGLSSPVEPLLVAGVDGTTTTGATSSPVEPEVGKTAGATVPASPVEDPAETETVTTGATVSSPVEPEVSNAKTEKGIEPASKVITRVRAKNNCAFETRPRLDKFIFNILVIMWYKPC